MLGRGHCRRPSVTQRSHVGGGPSAELQGLRQQPGTGGLAVGPGDAGHRQSLRWRTEETIRDAAGPLTQLWNSGHKNAGAECGHHRIRRLFIEHRTRAARRCLFHELEAVVGPTLEREEKAARGNRPTIERQVIDQDIAGHGNEP